MVNTMKKRLLVRTTKLSTHAKAHWSHKTPHSSPNPFPCNTLPGRRCSMSQLFDGGVEAKALEAKALAGGTTWTVLPASPPLSP